MTKEEIAIEFTKVVNEWLTPEELKEVNIRNATPEYNGCCATHDFCDANMAMDEAFKRLGGDLGVLIADDDQIKLVNEAWSLAKENKFNLTK